MGDDRGKVNAHQSIIISGSNLSLKLQQFPNETAGMVLVDSVDPEETLRFPHRFEVGSWVLLLLRATAPFGVPRDCSDGATRPPRVRIA